MEKMIFLIEKGMNAVGIWWVFLGGVVLGLIIVLKHKIQNAYFKEMNDELMDELNYLRRRLNVEQRIHEKIENDMIKKFGVFRQPVFDDDDDVIDIEPEPEMKRITRVVKDEEQEGLYHFVHEYEPVLEFEQGD